MAKNSNNEQMEILRDVEDDPKMELRHIDTRASDNNGFIITCHYHMKPDAIAEDTPYDKRHIDEEYVFTEPKKATAYVESKLSQLTKERAGGAENASPELD